MFQTDTTAVNPLRKPPDSKQAPGLIEIYWRFFEKLVVERLYFSVVSQSWGHTLAPTLPSHHASRFHFSSPPSLSIVYCLYANIFDTIANSSLAYLLFICIFNSFFLFFSSTLLLSSSRDFGHRSLFLTRSTAHAPISPRLHGSSRLFDMVAGVSAVALLWRLTPALRPPIPRLLVYLWPRSHYAHNSCTTLRAALLYEDCVSTAIASATPTALILPLSRCAPFHRAQRGRGNVECGYAVGTKVKCPFVPTSYPVPSPVPVLLCCHYRYHSARRVALS